MQQAKKKNKSVEQIDFDNEFEKFFISCEKFNLTETDLKILFRPLKMKLRFEYGIKILKIISLIIFVFCLFYYIPFLNWNITAIGRILLINLLPIWNWKPYFNSKCLISGFYSGTSENQISSNGYKLYRDDCVVCENYDYIERVINPSYVYLYEKHLLRGTPVIIENSHPVWYSDNFTEYLLSLDKLLSSDPCEMQSNLILGKYQTIGDLLERAESEPASDGWFLHFQNCDFEGVKPTRTIAKRPIYLATHLEPAHSNWILISQNYLSSRPKSLFVNGLILVMQLKGEIEIILSSKEPCFDICGEFSIILIEGEAMIFTTDLWTLMYSPTSSIKKSITFITETNWNP